jgi:hypothetical protein
VAVLVVEVVLDVVADDERCHLAEFEAAELAPAEETIDGAFVGLPRVRVADLRLEEVGLGVIGAGTGVADDRRGGDLASESFQVGVDDQVASGVGRDGRRQYLDFAFALIHDSLLSSELFGTISSGLFGTRHALVQRRSDSSLRVQMGARGPLPTSPAEVR